MTKRELAEQERLDAIKELRKIVKPGMTVYTILRHVSKSGMTRDISLVVFRKGQPIHLNYWAAKALGWTQRTGFADSIRVNGCGMDMGFHLVYSLSATIFAKSRKGDAGYKLKQRWL